MKFIATTDGYINADYVKRFDITDKKIALQDDTGASYFIDEKFDSDEDAQNCLDELIEELEADERPDAI
ncbi:MAG: hypothetical protein IJQ01_02600 [Selenomonadaceae bacterium]|nr:hypothetical protein [Selenomonadaceae bacterium]